MKDSKTKTLWLPSWYPTRKNPFFGIFIQRQAEAVSAFSDVAVLHALASDTEGYEFEITKQPFLTVIVYYPKTSNKWLKFFRYFKAIFKGYKIIKTQWGKPDLVHLHVIYSAGLMALWLNIFHQIPFVISEHWSGYRSKELGFSGFFLTRLAYACVKKAKRVIAISPFFASTMQQHQLKNAYKIIPNVVDTELFSPPQYLSNKNAKIKILHVSGLTDKEKNITALLNVLIHLAKKRSDFTCHFVGDDACLPPLIEIAKMQEELNKSVSFEGYLKPNEVAKRMQEADVFVMFSNFEGLPCVVLEAMSVGLPIIATETGGMNEWITDETGRLIEVGDEANLESVLNFMMDNFHQFDPSVIRSKIVERCSYQAIGRDISEVYKNVLGK